MSLSHTQARAVVINAFREVMGRDPTLAEAQAVQMIGAAESQYGAGWKTPEGAESFNWGAVQSGRPPCDPATSFLYTDSHPNSDGTSTKYQICFKRYSGHQAGAAHVVRLLFTSPGAKKAGTPRAAASGSVRELSAAMYRQGYYEGFGATPEQRIANHVKYISNWLNRITEELGEPKASEVTSSGSGGAGSGSKVLGGLLVLGGLYAGYRSLK